MENELARTQWRSSDGETARLDFCLWPVTSEDHVLILLLLWTNHLHYVFYWVSLGWFYLLDIHCDYSFISPLCGVAQTPDCGMLVVYLSFISPLCGVAPTPDCGIIISAFSARGVIQTLVWHQYYYSAFSARGVIQTLVWHPVFYFGIFLSICVHHGFSYIFVTDVWSSIKSGVCWIYYTRVLNVCEYIQTYSLACPWLLSWPDSSLGDKHRGDNLGTYVLTFAASRR